MSAAADFPEDWFPCIPYLLDEHAKRVRLGRARMAASRAVFCGLARDVERALAVMPARIARAGAMFRDHRVVVYENDSTDGTLARLDAWRRSDPRVEVLSERRGTERWGQVRDRRRTREMAACRNRYLEHALERHAAFEVLIVLDLDLERGFSYAGLASSFGYDGWHAMGSNGIVAPLVADWTTPPMFFDAWAFRPPGRAQALPFEQANRMHLRRGEPPLAVWSCFGGLAVYAMAALQRGARYAGDDCEHVELHRRMRAQGFDRLFLNPSQIVLYQGHG